MAEPQTNDAFLREKLIRFVDFLKACLKTRLNNSRFKEFSEKIEQLRTVDTAAFILHIQSDMCPYKSNIKAYVEKLLKEQDVALDALSAEEKTKLERYIACFIDIVNQ